MCAYNTKNLHSGYFHNFWWASQGHPKNDPKWRHQWDLLAKYVGKLEQMARWPAKHGGTYETWFSKVDLFISTLLTITSKSWGPRSRKWQPIVTRASVWVLLTILASDISREKGIEVLRWYPEVRMFSTKPTKLEITSTEVNFTRIEISTIIFLTSFMILKFNMRHPGMFLGRPWKERLSKNSNKYWS